MNGKNLEMLVLDEADNLLDQGFAEALFDIIKLLPGKEARQTLLFSATVPDKVQSMINAALKKGHRVLKMVQKGDAPVHTKVESRLVLTSGFENLLPTLYETIIKEKKNTQDNAGKLKPFKAICFFPTAKFASLAAQTFNLLRDESGKNPLESTRCIEIHSRLTQGSRERAARNFRENRSAVLFSSDVVARGMDFPDVTHIFQISSPRSLEQYIHRLGRTARGTSTQGLGYLFLSDFERGNAIRTLTPTIKFVEHTTQSAVARLDLSKQAVLPKDATDALTRIMEASQQLEYDVLKGAYLANLGYFAGFGDKEGLVESLNRWATLGWGMASPPKLSSSLAQKLGMGRVRGIQIARDSDRPSSAMGMSRSFSSVPPSGGRDGGFPPRGGDREGGFKPREGGFVPRGDREGGFKPREGGFVPRGDREGGFKPREGGFVPRGDREGGFRPREGGFVPRGDREGGFRPREGGFVPRGDREGGFKPREGGFTPRGDREGGFKPREGGFSPRGGGSFKPRQPWEHRGRQSAGKRFN